MKKPMKNFILILKNLINKFDNNFEKKVKLDNFNFKILSIILGIAVIVFAIIYFKNYLYTYIFINFIFNVLSFSYYLNIKKMIEKNIDTRFQEYINKREQISKDILKRKYDVKSIVVLDDLGNDQRLYEITKHQYLVGKKNNSINIDIDLSDMKNSQNISRVHARIYKDGYKWYILDLNSKNGTSVLKNNRKISLNKNEKINIRVSDIVYIHNTRLLIN